MCALILYLYYLDTCLLDKNCTLEYFYFMFTKGKRKVKQFIQGSTLPTILFYFSIIYLFRTVK